MGVIYTTVKYSGWATEYTFESKMDPELTRRILDNEPVDDVVMDAYRNLLHCIAYAVGKLTAPRAEHPDVTATDTTATTPWA